MGAHMPVQLGSVCINHPGIEAVARCRTCGKPMCGACTVAGPTGKFCSFECREKHEKFTKAAQDTEYRGRVGGGFSSMIRNLVSSVVVLAAVLLAAGVLSTVFEVPVLSGLTRIVRAKIGF
jgi:hypothetical protein